MNKSNKLEVVSVLVSPSARRVAALVALLFVVASGIPESFGRGLLFDFGADGTQTVGGTTAAPVYWNNLAGEGTDDFGIVYDLVNTDGAYTAVTLEMLSRFNGANESGTTASPAYPASASHDSLFGNTELFGDLENITPQFRLVGLDPSVSYTLTFYASRLGVSDNRETRYTVTGAVESAVDLDAANNVDKTVSVTGLHPDPIGQIVVALTPGPNNNNANHFTYLGVLEVKASTGETIMIDVGAGGSTTDIVEPTASAFWNNITPAIGGDAAGALTGAVDTNGIPTAVNLEMVSRFNGANSNGSSDATLFPVTSVQDSLFGNTETFSGLANVLPVFKLTGLEPNSAYSFTFFAARTGVSDNRETRYTITGANSASADLNAANNSTNVVRVESIRPDAAGEIQIALTAGPNNNNGNHFTYLGVMKVDETPIRSPRILVDFGATGRPTIGASDPENAWNNVTQDVGGNDTGSVANLVKTDGTATGITFQMVSRFNGANENGTELSGVYPLDATRDSLYGNTEEWSGVSDITPVFKLTGLDPSTAYDLEFYASRMGVGDNRETRYTVTGAAESSVDFNVANNETESVSLAGVKPTAGGEITVALTPGPNNDNAYHFTYLGILQIDWVASAQAAPATLRNPAYAAGKFRLTLEGTAGTTYVVRRTRDFNSWETAATVSLTGGSQEVEISQPESYYFYEAAAQ